MIYIPQCDVECKWLVNNQITLGGHLILQSKEYKRSKDLEYKPKAKKIKRSFKYHGLENHCCIFCKRFFEKNEKYYIKKIPANQLDFIIGRVKSIKPRSKKYKIQMEKLWNRLSKEEQAFLVPPLKQCISPNLKYYIKCKNCLRTRYNNGKLRVLPLIPTIAEMTDGLDKIDYSEIDEIHNPKFESDLFKNRVNIN